MAPLVVITGPTGSGKTGLALELAERFGGEIICADSRTVYKGMDIGTAKPTPEEQARVPHYLLDVVEPGEPFTAADFKRLADAAIAGIRSRSKVPFLVGGTGLYIDAVVLNYEFGEPADEKKRQELNALSIDELQSMIRSQRLVMPENPLNKRHLVRVLELDGQTTSRKHKPDDNTIVVAITTDKNVLRERVEKRAHDMFSSGVIEEAKQLGEKYGWESEAMTGNIYPILHKVINGEITKEEAVQKFITSDMRLVKRQLTWLRRHEYVKWLPLEQANDYIAGRLSH
jgi:tRNA dimethylallyltransferase